MTYHTQGLILKRDTWRDTGRIYTIYTRETGKVLAVGRGTRKVLSKLAAHLEPYSAVDLFLARGRRTETVCGAMMTRSPEPLASDQTRYVTAAFFAEAADQLIKWGERDEKLWSLMTGFLEDLSSESLETVSELLAGYLWRFMDHLGYGPLLDECSICGKNDVSNAWFLPTSGTVACQGCRPDERALLGAERIDPASVSELHAFFTDPSVKHVTSPAVIRAAHMFLEVHLDRSLISLPALRDHLPLPENKLIMAPQAL